MKPSTKNRRKNDRRAKGRATRVEKKQGLSVPEGVRPKDGGKEKDDEKKEDVVSSSLDVSGDNSDEAVELSIGPENFLGFDDIPVYNENAADDSGFSIGELPDLVGVSEGICVCEYTCYGYPVSSSNGISIQMSYLLRCYLCKELALSAFIHRASLFSSW